MWMFNYVTLNWTLLGGDTNGGQSSTTNWPSARYIGCNWIDDDGSLWMFGGWGVNAGTECKL